MHGPSISCNDAYRQGRLERRAEDQAKDNDLQLIDAIAHDLNPKQKFKALYVIVVVQDSAHRKCLNLQ